ncbi:hypothetical protein [Maritimibacter sp. DP1N21-5]|uniref:hypothetical protein n=1 Tax=Maritimibacter sp. DP1N21-5 TaxID=2836867 RepID=UPI001C485FC0|nr:hypothetical protein [Maritimibacter sp. DP1N21-5]MBV7410788.1 hypothetical protein [Maritimibacter sp. DP1N21-5]
MIRLRHLALLAVVLPNTLLAVDGKPLTPEEFEAYVTGKTLLYGTEGAEYGGEDYLPGRKVRWSYLDGDCKSGFWYAQDQQVCFIYEDRPDDPQCWSFYLDGGKLTALFENDPNGTELYETGISNEPLFCEGPEVGV